MRIRGQWAVGYFQRVWSTNLLGCYEILLQCIHTHQNMSGGEFSTTPATPYNAMLC